MSNVSLELLSAVIRASWSANTSVDPSAWSLEFPEMGQCAVTALVIQDFLDGSLLRAMVGNSSHYWNKLPNGREIDLTRKQFEVFEPTQINEKERSYLFSSDSTLARYLRLRNSVVTRLKNWQKTIDDLEWFAENGSLIEVTFVDGSVVRGETHVEDSSWLHEERWGVQEPDEPIRWFGVEQVVSVREISPIDEIDKLEATLSRTRVWELAKALDTPAPELAKLLGLKGVMSRLGDVKDRPTKKKAFYFALVDMDGTLANYEQKWKDALIARGLDPDERVSDEIEAEIRNQPGFWRDLPALDLGFQVMTLLKKLYFEIHILSKGPTNSPSGWGEKLEWVHHHLGKDTGVTISTRKDHVRGDILVEDWPKYLGPWLEENPDKFGILIDTPWNQEFSHDRVLRVTQSIVDSGELRDWMDGVLEKLGGSLDPNEDCWQRESRAWRESHRPVEEEHE